MGSFENRGALNTLNTRQIIACLEFCERDPVLSGRLAQLMFLNSYHAMVQKTISTP